VIPDESEEIRTLGDLVEALERLYPPLIGTISAPSRRERRPFLRFYVGDCDLSMLPFSDPLPNELRNGSKTLDILGAIAGG
jgi:hypothetical protein